MQGHNRKEKSGQFMQEIQCRLSKLACIPLALETQSFIRHFFHCVLFVYLHPLTRLVYNIPI